MPASLVSIFLIFQE